VSYSLTAVTPLIPTSVNTNGRPSKLLELVDDLSGKFLEHYEAGQERDAVAQYRHYFLGLDYSQPEKRLELYHDGPATSNHADIVPRLPEPSAAQLPEEGRGAISHLHPLHKIRQKILQY